MARPRRRNDQSISLFPFLDILSGVIGTFFLIIAGMTVLSIQTAVQIVELPRAEAQQKRPYYVDCRAAGVFLPQHPPGYLPQHTLEVPPSGHEQEQAENETTPGVLVPLAAMDAPDSPWQQQLAVIGAHRFDEYLILLVRQDGLASFNKARRDAEALGIDVGFSPVSTGGDIKLQMPAADKPSEADDELDFELGNAGSDDSTAENP